ncbi:hypothetical protein ACFVSN_02980 [Kitasatospora sp. NPDC057904]|uniref:hypothetical protein n=1 Tax=Kitasatospora sp. NPDC057904 TaxID=3346275 RepID=UPI0036DCC7F7
MILVQGRARLWVADGAVHWQRGRELIVVPGVWVRRVGVDGGTLTVELFDDTSLTLRHRLPEVARALADEIEPLIGDSPGPGDRPPIRDVTPPPAVVRAVRRTARALRASSPLVRVQIGHAALAVPVALLAGSWLTFVAWAMAAAGLWLIGLSLRVVQPVKRWQVWRRGVTVRAEFKPDFATYAKAGDLRALFRALDGSAHDESVRWGNRRNEVRYDLRDPSRVIAPTRVMWLADLLFGLAFGAGLGGALATPYLTLLLWLLLGGS